MKLKIFDENIYAINTYLIYNDETKNAIAIDPGLNGRAIISFVEENGLNLKYFLITHGHGDHIADLEMLTERFNIPIYIHEDDADYLENADVRLWEMFRKKSGKIKNYTTFKEGKEFELDGHIFKTLHTPGHTRGGICYYDDEAVFTGDTLFSGTIGRTDFPGGDYDEILRSLAKIAKLDNNLIIYPGHGPKSKISRELIINPFYEFMRK